MSKDDKETSRQHPASEPGADEVCAAPPVASSAREKPSTRDMILERRSRFIAAALAGAGLATAACGGRVAETSDAAGTAGTAGTGTGGGAAGGSTIYMQPQACLQPEMPDYGDNIVTVAAGAGGYLSTGGVGGAPYTLAGAAGAPQACLSGGAAPFVPTESPDAGEIEPEDPDGGL